MGYYPQPEPVHYPQPEPPVYYLPYPEPAPVYYPPYPEPHPEPAPVYYPPPTYPEPQPEYYQPHPEPAPEPYYPPQPEPYYPPQPEYYAPQPEYYPPHPSRSHTTLRTNPMLTLSPHPTLNIIMATTHSPTLHLLHTEHLLHHLNLHQRSQQLLRQLQLQQPQILLLAILLLD